MDRVMQQLKDAENVFKTRQEMCQRQGLENIVPAYYAALETALRLICIVEIKMTFDDCKPKITLDAEAKAMAEQWGQLK